MYKLQRKLTRVFSHLFLFMAARIGTAILFCWIAAGVSFLSLPRGRLTDRHKTFALCSNSMATPIYKTGF